MIHKIFFTAWLALSCLLLDSPVFAQTEVSPAESGDAGAAVAKTNPGSQEVEYNDDNYRRFMELRDEHTQRSSLAVNANQSGTQKLDKLPEASQKHLRNQLREIILEGNAWTPGEENKEFRYVASEAAQESPALQQQEAEAWGELVGKYHQREARIYADAARSKSDRTGNGDGRKQSAGEKQAASDPNQGYYSPSSPSSSSSSSASTNPGDPDAVSPSGVSQNALEYLLSNSEIVNSSEASATASATPEPAQLVVISTGTLSIKDLQNAQGITISTGTGSAPAMPVDSEDDGERNLPKN